MQEIHMNWGDKISRQLDGTTLTLSDGERKLSIDLAERQQDVQVTINICRDEDGNLVEGLAQRYVAVIVIPPRQYATEVVEEDGEQQEVRVPLPLDTDQVKLYLWAE